MSANGSDDRAAASDRGAASDLTAAPDLKIQPIAPGPDARAVERMFSGIARRYDFLNHLLSASVDHRWRRLAAERVVRLAGSPNPILLDLCSGTGDLAIELARIPQARVIAADFCHPMLTRAAPKIEACGFSSAVGIVEADALVLPLPDACCDAVTIAFGLRNLADRSKGIGEMRRVLKPGGALVVLEFSRPVAPVFRQVFEFYFHHVLPRLGAWISGDGGGAYTYLPQSVARFPAQKDLAAALRVLGFVDVDYRNLFGGVAALHWGRKPETPRAAL